MKVTKTQAQANRANIVETASALFRERGYDGVGVVDLMAAAGFTHGGFYKHFRSKADLMAESAACGIAHTVALTADGDMSEFVRHYLSREHRDTRATGCTMAALGGDAARQSEAVRAVFADGIERLVAALTDGVRQSGDVQPEQVRSKALSVLARAVGALVLSRACPGDSSLADEILTACRDEILEELGQLAIADRSAPGSIVN
jgi:TetR/AcrR family transcriptional regulator, transcriptional repressor for nem operon